MTMKLFLALLIFALTNCSNNNQQPASAQTDSSKNSEESTRPSEKEGFQKTEIVCDTVYKNKGYKITLTLFDTINKDEATNTLFTLSMRTNGQYVPILA